MRNLNTEAQVCQVFFFFFLFTANDIYIFLRIKRNFNERKSVLKLFRVQTSDEIYISR